ncbi:hypothetical protein [Paracoccus sp. S1E-3]|nr:hypothetical protein [Paracoccus sp. S1E-3]MBA4490606.1 hypothetical protein [Paracoccus sp. S1E-3]
MTRRARIPMEAPGLGHAPAARAPTRPETRIIIARHAATRPGQIGGNA